MMPTKLSFYLDNVILFDWELFHEWIFERERFAFWQNGFTVNFDISPIYQYRIESTILVLYFWSSEEHVDFPVTLCLKLQGKPLPLSFHSQTEIGSVYVIPIQPRALEGLLCIEKAHSQWACRNTANQDVPLRWKGCAQIRHNHILSKAVGTGCWRKESIKCWSRFLCFS